MDKKQKIFGIVEHVNLPQFELFNVAAKVDTGAYSGALHAENIQETTDKTTGKRTVSFDLPHVPNKRFTLKKYIRTFVRSSNGHRRKRFLFRTAIMIDNIEYPIKIGLSDRSDLHYDILVGRRFLSENNILVDVRKNEEHYVDKGKKNENSNII